MHLVIVRGTFTVCDVAQWLGITGLSDSVVSSVCLNVSALWRSLIRLNASANPVVLKLTNKKYPNDFEVTDYYYM